MKYKVGPYEITVARADEFLEITALIRVDGHILRSEINNVNGIMGLLLSDRQIHSGDFDDTPWKFGSIRSAERVERHANDIFTEAQKPNMLVRQMMIRSLNEDRAEGEWSEK